MTARLPSPVRRVLREPFDDSHADAAWRRRQLARASAPPRSWVPMGIVGFAASAALVFALTRGAGEPGPLHLAGGALPADLWGAARFDLDDGSSIELGEDARLETLENEGRAFGLLLRVGAATFDVTPGGPRRWTIECGLATVVVVGTGFTIERAPDRLRVSVDHGVVLVRGARVPEGARRLEAGESIEVQADAMEARASDAASAVDRPTAAGPVAPVPAVLLEPGSPPARPETAVSESAALEPETPSWRDLAHDTAYSEAYAALGPGGLEREAARASVDDLLMLADVARLSGHPADAIEPLERLVTEHPADAHAALAAFTLGTVEAGSMHRPERAARAFERALDLGITRALRADALCRLARARRDAGELDGAREAAARYLAEFPEGPQVASMSALARESE